MGSTPTGYPLTSENIKTLSGLSGGFTSEQLKGRTDVPSTSFTSADLLGLTDTVSYPPIWTAGTSVSKFTTTTIAVAYLYLNSNGTIDLNAGTDGTWLPSGRPAGNYRAKWVRTGGITPGYSTGWTQNTWATLSATRSLNVSAQGYYEFSNFDITIEETATGASITKSISMSAESTGGGGGCPLCCFTPETPVLLASGVEVPIGKIREGDIVLTMRGPEAVSGIIVRENREMYRVDLEGGQTIRTSEDHPVYVVDKGYASIRPPDYYKDMGTPERLAVGDIVVSRSGLGLRVLGIEKIHYPGKVYTLENTEFFAGGILVY